MEKLTLMPRHERQDAIESLVVEEFKAALFMTERDELPLDVGFFDLGLTSLRLSELKLTLERRLECEISTAVLFGHPTAGHLIDYLSE